MSKDATSRRLCRCEARIAAAVLEGYACGNPDCWRTQAARDSFDDFVSRLKAKRGETPLAEAPPTA